MTKGKKHKTSNEVSNSKSSRVSERSVSDLISSSGSSREPETSVPISSKNVITGNTAVNILNDIASHSESEDSELSYDIAEGSSEPQVTPRVLRTRL